MEERDLSFFDIKQHDFALGLYEEEGGEVNHWNQGTNGNNLHLQQPNNFRLGRTQEPK